TAQVGLMKCLSLQFLLLLCTVGLPVSGKWKDRMLSEIRIPDYILSRPKLPQCMNHPTSIQCKTFCKAQLECQVTQSCCAFCGNVCMSLEDAEDVKSDYNIINKMSTVVP
uniref:WAP domain-containing protein n=1 Tax=Nannospalax galili TaxID=1026970 RepID=A0A8C6W4U6_NANGA